MIIKDFYIRKYDWELRCYFAVDSYYAHEIMEDLYKLGINPNSAKRAFRNLLESNDNTGLCYSSFEDRKSVIVTSLTTEAKEFAHSWVHEITHCACHIAQVDCIDLKSEQFCYLVGDIAKMTFKNVSKLLCDCCKKKQRKYYGKEED